MNNETETTNFLSIFEITIIFEPSELKIFLLPSNFSSPPIKSSPSESFIWGFSQTSFPRGEDAIKIGAIVIFISLEGDAYHVGGVILIHSFLLRKKYTKIIFTCVSFILEYIFLLIETQIYHNIFTSD